MIKRIACISMLFLGIALGASAQDVNGGLLYASDFGRWQLPQGNSPTSGMIQWPNSSICSVTSGGFTFAAVKIGRPLKIVDVNPAQSEVVTPTSVHINNSTCTVTAPMSFTHLAYTVQSGTAGLQEAIDYATVGSQQQQVVLTPAWRRIGGTSDMITAAAGNVNVTILDQRSSQLVPYLWNGNQYVATAFPAGAGGSNLQIQSNVNGALAGLNISTDNSWNNLLVPGFVSAQSFTFGDSSVQSTSQQGALSGSANDATARSAASAAQTTANSAQTTANAALPANGASSTGSGTSNLVTFPGTVKAPMARFGGPVANAVYYGAVADATTYNDTAIAAAIAAVPVGGRVYFPQPTAPGGYYLIHNTITVPCGISIEGEPWAITQLIGSKIQIDQDLPVVQLTGGTPVAADCTGAYWKNLYLRGCTGVAGCTQTQPIVILKDVAQIRADNLTIGNGSGGGLVLKGVQDSSFSNFYVQNLGTIEPFGAVTAVAISTQSFKIGCTSTPATNPCGGTGYAVGDTVTDSEEGSVGAVYTVATVASGGVVTGLTLTTAGTDHVNEPGVATTHLTGTGTGLRVDITTRYPAVFVGGDGQGANSNNITFSKGDVESWRSGAFQSVGDPIDGSNAQIALDVFKMEGRSHGNHGPALWVSRTTQFTCFTCQPTGIDFTDGSNPYSNSGGVQFHNDYNVYGDIHQQQSGDSNTSPTWFGVVDDVQNMDLFVTLNPLALQSTYANSGAWTIISSSDIRIRGGFVKDSGWTLPMLDTTTNQYPWNPSTEGTLLNANGYAATESIATTKSFFTGKLSTNGTDLKSWDIFQNSAGWILRGITDANAPTSWLTFHRSVAATASDATFNEKTVVPSLQVNGGPILDGASSTATKIVTCPSGGTGSQVCNASGAWQNSTAGTMILNAQGSCSGVATASASTQGLWGFGSTGTACSATRTAGSGLYLWNASTVNNWAVSCATAGVNASSGLFTLYDYNGTTATAITGANVTFGTTAANTVLTGGGTPFGLSAGHRLTVGYTTQAAETLGNCTVWVQYTQ